MSRVELDNLININFPNGCSTKIPRDIMMMFECDDLKNASPYFINNILLVYTEEGTLRWMEIFAREKAKLMQLLKKAPFDDFKLNEHFEEVLKDFVIPFVNKLSETRVKNTTFWQMKSLVIRFYKFLDGLLANLISIEKELRLKDDPVYLPVKTKGQMVAANL
jgi:hypothetical protein